MLHEMCIQMNHFETLQHRSNWTLST